MNMPNSYGPDAKFIKPPNRIKMKVGAGGIDENLIEMAQTKIENTSVDFIPFANKHLKRIKTLLKSLQKAQNDAKREELANAIMQIKANGGMFGYSLISDIAAVALYFLENIKALNNDAITIINVHYQTMTVIISNGLKGDGGQEGYALAKELESAANRYFKKYPA